jgi:hypothetical protein
MTPITEPGVYDLDADVYHADPVAGGALSQSGIKRLLAPSCPALFKWWRDHPTVHKPDYDFGHMAHKLILGRGAEIAEIDAANYLTKAAKAAKAAAYDAGHIPALPGELEVAKAMAAAVFEHPQASVLLDPKRGKAEQTLVWRDPGTDIMCRGMVDFLTHPVAGQPYFLPDYKTSYSAAPPGLGRIMANLGYHTAGAWYTAGVAALGIHPNPQYVLIVQEKTPPYLVTVAFPDPTAMVVGRERCATAVQTFIECTKADRWPGYSDEPVYISLPPWVEREHTLESW